MDSCRDKTRSRRSWPLWRWILTGLSILALALSTYLSWHYLVGGSMIGCAGGSSCEEVLSSRWSAIGGVLPVSGLAAGAYLAMLLASLFIGQTTETPVRRLAWGAMLVIVGAAAGSAIWFTILQKWVIGAFCPYCMTAHITGLLLAALVIWRAPKQIEEDSIDVTPANAGPNAKGETAHAALVKDVSPAVPRRLIGRLPAMCLAFMGLGLAGIMAVAQVVVTPPPIYVAGESQDNLPVIDPHAVPLVGSPDADYVVTLLFDYKCPHCQQLHFMLNEAIRRYDGKLAFALCPAPLNKQCNPYIVGEADEYKDSCELARIGLAVWLANRNVYTVFENWMFSFDSGDRWHPRSLDAARAKAVELLGRENFEAAFADPWIDKYMATCVQIYGQTIQGGRGGVPRLTFGSRWVTPEPVDGDELVSILQDSLGVPMP